MTKDELGSWGEDYAVGFLQKKGFQILERNVRFKKNEIDIVAKIGGELIRKIMGLCDDESVFTDDLFDLDDIIEKNSRNHINLDFLPFINHKPKKKTDFYHDDIV